MESAIVHYNRALNFERAGRYEEAVASYRESIRLDPTDIDAHVNLGYVLRELGRDAEANEAFQAALTLRTAGIR